MYVRVCATREGIFLNNSLRRLQCRRRLERSLTMVGPEFLGCPTCSGRPCRVTRPRLASVYYTSVRVNYELYGRSCRKMTYIRNGLRERASTSIALAPGSPLCRVADRNGGSESEKKKSSSVTGFLCTPKFPRSFALRREKAVRKRPSRALKISMLIS